MLFLPLAKYKRHLWRLKTDLLGNSLKCQQFYAWWSSHPPSSRAFDFSRPVIFFFLQGIFTKSSSSVNNLSGGCQKQKAAYNQTLNYREQQNIHATSVDLHQVRWEKNKQKNSKKSSEKSPFSNNEEVYALISVYKKVFKHKIPFFLTASCQVLRFFVENATFGRMTLKRVC